MPLGISWNCPRVASTPLCPQGPGSMIGTALVCYVCLGLIIITLVVYKGRFPRPACAIFVVWYILWFAYQFIASIGIMQPIVVAGDVCI